MPALCALPHVPVTPRADSQETSAQDDLDIMLTAIKTETFLLTVSRPTEVECTGCKLSGAEPFKRVSLITDSAGSVKLNTVYGPDY